MSIAPDTGEIARVRTRHYVVDGASGSPHGTVVDLACIDDDSQGSRLSAIFFNVVGELSKMEDNMRYWRKWLEEVDNDLQTEPARIADFYQVKATRIEPVGIVYLWPA
jgi:hypothetical protein